MTVSAITQGAQPTASSQEPASEKKASLTSDYEMFLKMLTTQMTNQDPLNPVDSSDYAVQLATFSSVEQQVLTNDLLLELTSQIGNSELSDMAAYVGNEVRSGSPVVFSGSPVEIWTPIATGADSAKLTVRNQRGDIVQEFDLDPKREGVTWTGEDETGAKLPAGQYSFEVTSFANQDILSQSAAGTYSRIIEAQSTPDGLQLILESGIAITPNDVKAMRQ